MYGNLAESATRWACGGWALSALSAREDATPAAHVAMLVQVCDFLWRPQQRRAEPIQRVVVPYDRIANSLHLPFAALWAVRAGHADTSTASCCAGQSSLVQPVQQKQVAKPKSHASPATVMIEPSPNV